MKSSALLCFFFMKFTVVHQIIIQFPSVHLCLVSVTKEESSLTYSNLNVIGKYTQQPFYYQLYRIHTAQCTVYSVQYTVNNIHHTVYTIQYTLYSIHYTLYLIHYTLYTIHYTLYLIHYTLYTIPSTLESLQYALNTITILITG